MIGERHREPDLRLERGHVLTSSRLTTWWRRRAHSRLGRTDPTTIPTPRGPDQDRFRGEIQAPADEVEAPGDKLARLRAPVIRIDREPTLPSAARRIRRRLPGDEKFGDPWSTAGRTPVEVIARGVSALQPGRESVAKELGLSAAIGLGGDWSRARRPRVGAALHRPRRISAWALQAGDVAVLERLREIVGTVVERVEDLHIS